MALWTVNTYSEFEVNFFSNNREITKCRSFCRTTMMPMKPNNDNTNAIAIPRVSSNKRAMMAVDSLT